MADGTVHMAYPVFQLPVTPIGHRRAECGYMPDTSVRIVRDAEQVTCPVCLQQMAERVAKLFLFGERWEWL